MIEAASGSCKTKYKKYDNTYLNHGVACVEVSGEECPDCVLCMKGFPNESMLPSKFNRH